MPMCQRCKTIVNDDDLIKIKGKNFHQSCGQLYQDSSDLQDYICQLFNYKKPGPRVQTQIKTFTQEYGYTYSGIHKTLVYFFEVKQNTIQKSNGGIGIVPYVYDEAQEYYRKLNKTAERMAANIQPHKTRVVSVEAVQVRNNMKKRQEIDLSSLE